MFTGQKLYLSATSVLWYRVMDRGGNVKLTDVQRRIVTPMFLDVKGKSPKDEFFTPLKRPRPIAFGLREQRRRAPSLLYFTFTLATRSFKAGAALKRTALEALILMVSPVAGLRPVRAARWQR